MAYWKQKRVFVTGCTGMVGSWLTMRLVQEGAYVVGLIRDLVPGSNLRRSGLETQIVTVRGDVTDYALLLRVLNEYEIDTCFHLAAQTIVTIANRSPLSTFEANIRGTWTLLEAARHTATLGRVVIASSDKAYGPQETLPYPEDAPLIGRYPYDVSKSCVDLLGQAYFHTYQLPIGIARCGNIFGGGDLNFNRVVPGTMRSVYYGEDPIIRSDGSPVRDYVYVQDAVQAYLLLAQSLEDPTLHGQAFNFSYEQPQTVRQVVERILSALHKDTLSPQILGQGSPPGEIPRQYLASEKARRLLGWQPQFTFEEGLQATYSWYQEFFDSQERKERKGDSA